MKEFDVVVIGGGPGGYVAAIRAAQLGKSVACVDAREKLGGTCLNVGCIPSKSLLSSSHKYFEAKNHFAAHGIEFTGLKFSLDQMQTRKEQVVDALGKGVAGLFKKNGITYIKGFASFVDNHTVHVDQGGTEQAELKAQYVIIATGSTASSLPGIEIDEQRILSSTGVLELCSVPERMIVLGGGVIGLEMASIWSRLGSHVTIVEYMDRIIASCDVDISREVQKILEKQGMKFMLNVKALGAVSDGSEVTLRIEGEASGGDQQLRSDVLLVAVGRKPYTENLHLANAGIAIDQKGYIQVNNKLQTSAENVFAIGDVVVGPMLAHKASEEGVAVAEIICGQSPHINYDTIPSVIYTTPEVAVVGKTEAALKLSGIAYKASKFPFLANSRARTSGETDGFVKIIVDEHDTILGAQVIGPAAGELISEICVGMEFKAAAEDIARISHSHPGYSEAIKEAALGAFSKPIHI